MARAWFLTQSSEAWGWGMGRSWTSRRAFAEGMTAAVLAIVGSIPWGTLVSESYSLSEADKGSAAHEKGVGRNTAVE